jgi:dihydrofolate reductase
MKVFIIAAQSQDGFIARSTHELADWTTSEDKKVFVRLTKAAGTMVMGSTTFHTIGRALPGRRTIVYTHHPETITVPEVETTSETPQALVKRLASEGAKELAICGGSAIYTLFMKAGLVDELYITVVPVVFGGGVPLFTEPIADELVLLDSEQLTDEVVLHHYAVKHEN